MLPGSGSEMIYSDPTPDPAKSYGSDRIRIRLRIQIQTTVFQASFSYDWIALIGDIGGWTGTLIGLR
jgi:hypothetical protein